MFFCMRVFVLFIKHCCEDAIVQTYINNPRDTCGLTHLCANIRKELISMRTGLKAVNEQQYSRETRENGEMR